MEGTLARTLHRLLEPCHALVYFAPEAKVAYAEAGLKGQWMGYFASRAAPMGAVGPEAVTATFYGFAPKMVHRALPDAWALASPEQVLRARLAVADEALRRLLGDRVGDPALAEAATLARAAAESAQCAGRPLGAAHQALDWPDEPHLVLWHAASILREHRGDGHVAVLVANELDGPESLLTMAAVKPSYGDFVRNFRGWEADEIAAAEQRLAERGLLDGSGAGTEACTALRARIEDDTDRLALQPYRELGAQRAEQLCELLGPIVAVLKGA